MKKGGAPRKKRIAKRARRQTKKRKAVELRNQSPRLGLEATVEHIVEHQHTIQAFNSDLPAVLSTPSMIGLMEHATVAAIHAELPLGVISVGTRVEVDHLKAVPPGATVRAFAKFVKYEGRFLVFDVEARSGEHMIGRGRVFRAIVDPQKHGEKAQARIRE